MSTLRSFFLDGPAGRLESLLNSPPPGVENQTRLRAALVCHPHPKGGGTMHNKVVYHAMKALVGLGLPVLRFNFRGVGASDGRHDDGQGEQQDVRAALDWLSVAFGEPLLFAGFSFGSAVGLRVCCADARVAGMIALGIPVAVENMRRYEYPWLAGCTQPKLFVSGDQDEYGPVDGVQGIVAGSGGENELVLVSGATHFFQSASGPKLAEMQAAVRAWTLKRFAR